MTKPTKPKSHFRIVFDVYRSLNGKTWRWRAWSKNGKIIAHSGEDFKRKASAIAACDLLQDYAVHSSIFVNGKELE